MKKMNRLFKIALPFLLLAQINVFSQEQKKEKEQLDFKKTKALNKSYSVSSTNQLNIENQFGAVEVHTWNKNEIMVYVSIEVSANSDALAQQIMDGIVVTDDKSGGEINFKTTFKGYHNTKNGQSVMSVKYSISMPNNNPLKIFNQFGDIILPDMIGEVDLTAKFGSLTTGTLYKVKNLTVEFGKADIVSMNNSFATFKYSEVNIAKLAGKMKLLFDFCGKVKLKYGGAIDELQIVSSYSTVNLNPIGSDAAYTIGSSFGSFINRSDIKINEVAKGNNSTSFDKLYEGKSGAGNGSVKVSDHFGKIIIGEATEEDFKKEEKKKNKDKDKHKAESV